MDLPSLSLATRRIRNADNQQQKQNQKQEQEQLNTRPQTRAIMKRQHLCPRDVAAEGVRGWWSLIGGPLWVV